MPKTSIMKIRLGDKCVICNKRKEEGLHVVNSFICSSCETKMVQVNENDQTYHTLVKQMRNLSSNFIRK
ncbi:sigma factor G inhibitor Gin [Halalkalibacter lacteus]|uniref:sigma factor G inhibitor Gin n=1 Tax=Halalkalibacter lacteus TaxID=3090663 RepID=UPI002FC7787F